MKKQKIGNIVAILIILFSLQKDESFAQITQGRFVENEERIAISGDFIENNLVIVSDVPVWWGGGLVETTISIFNTSFQKQSETMIVPAHLAGGLVSTKYNNEIYFAVGVAGSSIAFGKTDGFSFYFFNFSNGGLNLVSAISVDQTGIFISSTKNFGLQVISHFDLNGSLLWEKDIQASSIRDILILPTGTVLSVQNGGNYYGITLDAVGDSVSSFLFPVGYSFQAFCLDRNDNIVSVLKKNQNSKLYLYSGGSLFPIKQSGNINDRKGDVVSVSPSFAGFIIAGSFSGTTSEGSLIAEIDSLGNCLWNRTFANTLGKSFCNYFFAKQNNCSFFILGKETQFNNMVLTKINYVKPIADVSPSGSVTICNGDTLLLTASPSFAYQWQKNGVPILGAVSSELYITKKGNYKAVVTNSFGCSKTTPTVIVSTGVCRQDEIKGDKNLLSFYPNPTTDYVVIENIKVGDEIVVVDLIGRTLIKEKSGSTEEVINISMLKPGNYFLIIASEKSFRFVKQ